MAVVETASNKRIQNSCEDSHLRASVPSIDLLARVEPNWDPKIRVVMAHTGSGTFIRLQLKAIQNACCRVSVANLTRVHDKIKSDAAAFRAN
jgi:hypothetical protein